MAITERADRCEHYDDVAEGCGVAQDRRAAAHRDRALAALADGRELAALVEAVLSLEARVEEAVCYVARLS